MTLFHTIGWTSLAGVLFALLSGFVLEYLYIPRILLISRRKRLYDIPDGRKSHGVGIPRLAGVSFLPAFLPGFLAVVGIGGGFVRELPFFICGILVVCVMGLKDDLVGMRWSRKLVLQLAAAGCLVCSGTWLTHLHGLFGIGALPLWAGVPLTLFLVIFMQNAVNLIDGVDGLAAGLVALAAVVLGVGLWQAGQYHYAALAAALLGTLLAFLRYNLGTFRGLKIFMGDTGSNLLGYVTAFLALRYLAAYAGPAADSQSGSRAVAVAVVVLFVPMLDTLWVVVTRWRQGKPLFAPDRNHLHHKLLALGCAPHRVTVVLLLWDVFLVGMTLLLAGRLNINWVLAADLLLGGSFYAFLHFRKKSFHINK